MKGLIITNKGIEHISALEVKELLKIKDIEQDDFIVKFPIKNLKDLELLKNKSRSASRIIYLFGEASITKKLDSTIINFNKIINNVSLDKFLKNKIYRIDCKRLGKHDFKSVDVSKEIANILIKKGYDKVSFKNPEVIIYIFINDKKGYIGIDVSGDISKREYRIFINPKSIKGNIAYALVRESCYNKNKTLVDPFCLSGEIVIEAALFANKKSKLKIYGYDIQRNVIAAKKNSKIANVDKLITFADYDISWLNKRHKKNSVDIIATKLLESSKHKRKEQIENIYTEFFNKCNDILKPKGKIVLISKDIKIIKKTKGKFKIVKSLTIYSGEMPLNIHVLEK